MELTIEFAEDFAEVESFVCGISGLDSGKRLWADYQLHHLVVFYYVRDAVTDTIVAVFALQNDLLSLDADDKEDMKSGFVPSPQIFSEDFEEEFSSRRDFPAIELALLVVSKPYQRQGVGSDVIRLIFDRLRETPQSGCLFVTVQALAGKSYSTLRFYERNGFSNCFPTPRGGLMRMFAPLYPEVA